MKKALSVLAVIVIALSLFSCARKTKPTFNIKHESVKSIDFRRAEPLPDGKNFYSKTVTDKQDIESLLKWIESLKLEKSEPIEVPIENIDYVIFLRGVKDHKLVFMDEYVVYDTSAYTYKNSKSASQVTEKYNLLNYTESKADNLGII